MEREQGNGALGEESGDRTVEGNPSKQRESDMMYVLTGESLWSSTPTMPCVDAQEKSRKKIQIINRGTVQINMLISK